MKYLYCTRNQNARMCMRDQLDLYKTGLNIFRDIQHHQRNVTLWYTEVYIG